jgi:hypothetical protein
MRILPRKSAGVHLGLFPNSFQRHLTFFRPWLQKIRSSWRWLASCLPCAASPSLVSEAHDYRSNAFSQPLFSRFTHAFQSFFCVRACCNFPTLIRLLQCWWRSQPTLHLPRKPSVPRSSTNGLCGWQAFWYVEVCALFVIHFRTSHESSRLKILHGI